jgi:hypothetical protein
MERLTQGILPEYFEGTKIKKKKKTLSSREKMTALKDYSSPKKGVMQSRGYSQPRQYFTAGAGLGQELMQGQVGRLKQIK